MKYKITLLFLFLFGNIIAQNLVLNSSFEVFKKCPKNKGLFHKNVTNWTCSNYGSTDYFNACSDALGYYNYVGNQKPKTGDGYAGIYTYAPGSYREYMQTKLVKKLIRGTNYTITFYVSLADCSSHAINNFLVLFTDSKLNNKSSSFIHRKHLDKDKIKYDFLAIMDSTFYTNTQKWIKISGTYTAKGFENYISIGNFDVNKKIEIKEVWSTAERQFAYYYIDDVSVIPTSLIEEELIKEAPLELQKTYTFKNVLFDLDKAELLNNSIEELDKLYFHLIENKNLYIEIYGHTDSVGLQKRNEELSMERAKSVSNYLVLKGLDKQRIKWFGFGSTKPISANDSEDKRAQNRRVEFKLIQK